MISLIIVSLITGLFYLLWKNERQGKPAGHGPSIGRMPVWLLLGILSLLALLSPAIREKARDLRQKYRW